MSGANSNGFKVRVVKFQGASHPLGWMDPKAGMVTHKGTISSVNSNGQLVVVDVGTGVPKNFYARDLLVTEAEATGNWSYPTGDGSYQFGHGTTWPNGVPDGLGTGVSYLAADGTVNTYGRVGGL